MTAVEGNFIAVRHFNHFAEIHDTDVGGYMLDHAQVMGYKQVGQSIFSLQILQHVDYLCLNGYIQRRNRLVTDNEFRDDGYQ